MREITQKSNVLTGVVPTHLKFVGGLVPDEQGQYPPLRFRATEDR